MLAYKYTRCLTNVRTALLNPDTDPTHVRTMRAARKPAVGRHTTSFGMSGTPLYFITHSTWGPRSSWLYLGPYQWSEATIAEALKPGATIHCNIDSVITQMSEYNKKALGPEGIASLRREFPYTAPSARVQAILAQIDAAFTSQSPTTTMSEPEYDSDATESDPEPEEPEDLLCRPAVHCVEEVVLGPSPVKEERLPLPEPAQVQPTARRATKRKPTPPAARAKKYNTRPNPTPKRRRPLPLAP